MKTCMQEGYEMGERCDDPADCAKNGCAKARAPTPPAMVADLSKVRYWNRALTVKEMKDAAVSITTTPPAAEGAPVAWRWRWDNAPEWESGLPPYWLIKREGGHSGEISIESLYSQATIAALAARCEALQKEKEALEHDVTILHDALNEKAK